MKLNRWGFGWFIRAEREGPMKEWQGNCFYYGPNAQMDDSLLLLSQQSGADRCGLELKIKII